MKHFLIGLALGLLIWALFAIFHTSETDALNQQYRTTIDSLQGIQEKRQDTIVQLQNYIDSIKTKEYDTVYLPIYRKANSVKYLNADSTVRLFNELQRQLQDSNYRERYLRDMSVVGNIQLGSGNTVQ